MFDDFFKIFDVGEHLVEACRVCVDPTVSTPSATREKSLLLERLDKALAEVDHLAPLGEARFLETHAVFEGRSDQRQRIIDWLGDWIAPAGGSGQPFRVLSIGSGSGIVDVSIARQLATGTDELSYVGVDPNRVECEAFDRLFTDAALPGARLEVAPVTFEDFETSQRFDLVHFVHSLYYMPNPAAALRRARRQLAPDGNAILEMLRGVLPT